MKLTYISILRSLSILTVVSFHVYEFMYSGHFPQTKNVYHDMYWQFNQCVGINIAMPMFTLIAGYLFDYLYGLGKYQELLPLMRKKSKRLLLPFLVFGMLMMATIRIGAPFKPWMVYKGDIAHLWYLAALFWCFPLAWLIKKYVGKVWLKTGLMVLFLFMTIWDGALPPMLGLQFLPHWFGWFMLGEMLACYHERLFAIVKRYRLLVLLLVPFVLLEIFAPIAYRPWYGANTWYSVPCTAMALVGIMYAFANMGGQFLRLCQPLVWLSKYSFGIYLFHCWMGPYMISSTAKRLFPLEELAARHIVLFPLLLTISVIAVSWALTWLMMRTKVGRMLIGG